MHIGHNLQHYNDYLFILVQFIIAILTLISTMRCPMVYSALNYDHPRFHSRAQKYATQSSNKTILSFSHQNVNELLKTSKSLSLGFISFIHMSNYDGQTLKLLSSLFITGTLMNCRTQHVDRFIMFKGINCSCAFYSSLIFILKTKLWIVVAQPPKRVIVVCYDTLLFYTNFILPVRSSISTLKIITILLCMYMHQPI